MLDVMTAAAPRVAVTSPVLTWEIREQELDTGEMRCRLRPLLVVVDIQPIWSAL
jgi:hypothetical protein